MVWALWRNGNSLAPIRTESPIPRVMQLVAVNTVTELS
jgi:hypothetical protein